MKIIKQGVNPMTQPVRATCGNCSTEVEFLPDDPKVQYVPDQRDGDFYRYTCPCCNKSVTRSVVMSYYGPG